MKKLILIMICLLVSGCYNYEEPNELAIVDAMIVDYQAGEYKITLEIQETKQKSLNTSYLVHASGASIKESLNHIKPSFDKKLYFANLEILMMSFEVTNQHLSDMINYIINDYNFAFNFNLALSDDAEEVIQLINDKGYIFGNYMRGIFRSENNREINIIYSDFIVDYINHHNIDLPHFSVSEDELVVNLTGVNYE